MGAHYEDYVEPESDLGRSMRMIEQGTVTPLSVARRHVENIRVGIEERNATGFTNSVYVFASNDDSIVEVLDHIVSLLKGMKNVSDPNVYSSGHYSGFGASGLMDDMATVVVSWYDGWTAKITQPGGVGI